jgi:hypothetical protein
MGLIPIGRLIFGMALARNMLLKRGLGLMQQLLAGVATWFERRN